MLAYGSNSESPRSSGDGPEAACGPPPDGDAAGPSRELLRLSLAAGNVVKLKGLPFKSCAERDVARFFAAFRLASAAAPEASVLLRRHPDGRLTGEVRVLASCC